jgi:hypothetical protein
MEPVARLQDLADKPAPTVPAEAASSAKGLSGFPEATIGLRAVNNQVETAHHGSFSANDAFAAMIHLLFRINRSEMGAPAKTPG